MNGYFEVSKGVNIGVVLERLGYDDGVLTDRRTACCEDSNFVEFVVDVDPVVIGYFSKSCLVDVNFLRERRACENVRGNCTFTNIEISRSHYEGIIDELYDRLSYCEFEIRDLGDFRHEYGYFEENRITNNVGIFFHRGDDRSNVNPTGSVRRST